MRSPIVIYVMQWHLANSPAVRIVLEEPLKHMMNITLRDRVDFKQYVHASEVPLIFVQQEPPVEALDSHKRILWAPMWDYAVNLSDTVWQSLPKHLRVLAFSDRVLEKAQMYNLSALRLRFYLNPETMSPIEHDNERTLFYWNRKALFSREVLAWLCEVMAIDRLLFRDVIDPNLPGHLQYSLPAQFGKTRVEIVPNALSRDAYLSYLNQATIFIAPRELEGIGVAFLEAMAKGSMVLALDRPTMNEYIIHERNGYLLPVQDDVLIENNHHVYRWLSAQSSTERQIRYQMANILSTLPHYRSPLDIDRINGDALAALPYRQVGEQARADHFSGYAAWQAQLPELVDFVLNW